MRLDKKAQIESNKEVLAARHISKFDKDYGRDTWGCKKRVTYREV
jgi:hypothetical protein